MSPRRVLCYAPYNRWELHGLWEMTVLNALKLRGAEVEYVLCDGLYSDCDQYWKAVTGPRPANACAACQAQVAQLAANMQMDFKWLGRFLTPQESRTARQWSQDLTELAGARYEDWEIGEWMRGSVQSHLRERSPDLSDPAVEHAMRSYAYSGLIAAFALDRLLQEADPEVLFLFNGRQSSTRVALELARARGIRVIVHERGPRSETLMLVENEICISLAPVRRYWEEWGEIPLEAQELEQVAGFMADREHGRNLGWKSFATAPSPQAEVRAQLGLSDERPTWVLFTSSDDEISSADYGSPFASQLEWIERTVAYAREHPGVDLIIRVHPNTGSSRSTGAAQGQLDELSALAARLPENVRMIDADSAISSYSLMSFCALGLVWVSTVGLELACRGKDVVVAAGCAVSGTPFVRTVTDAGDYEGMLDSRAEVDAKQVQRLALRHAYGLFFRMRIDFPLVTMPDAHNGRLAYNTLDALAPGQDAGVDRCARILLEDEPVCPPPSPQQRQRTEVAEDWFLSDREPAKVA